MPNDAEVDALVHSIDLVAYASQHLQLTKSGAEWKALCPWHDDHSPSLSINGNKQVWACWSCGAQEKYGADLIGFVRSWYECSFPEAILKLRNGNGAGDGKPIIRPALKKKPPRILEVPPAGSEPDTIHPKLGPPLKTWTICTRDGRPFMYECRYIALSGPDKETRPWSYGRYSESEPARWDSKWPESARPFWGLEQLGKHPRKVWIWESAGKAEAARELFPDRAHLGLMAGCYAIAKMDLSPLAGRHCVLIPDHDEAGKDAMKRLASLLWAAGAAKVKGINPETQPHPDDPAKDGPESPLKWDIKDAVGWTPKIALAWANARVIDYPAPQQTAQDALEAPTARADDPGADAPAGTPKARKTPPDLTLVDDTGALRKPSPKRQEIDPEPEQLPAFSEFALAQRFADGPGQDWRYTAAWLEWAKWNGTRWVPDEVKSITFTVKNCCTAAMQEHVSQSTPSQRMKLTTLKTVNAVMGLVSSFPGIATAAASWDSDTMLLGTPAGIVDLRTGAMIPSAQEQMISKATSCAPEAGAHPWWDRVLGRATGDIGSFLQRWCGYMLTGDTREERFLFIHGPGGGGKSKFLLVLSEILGDYRRTAKMESFTAQSRQEHSEEIARLAGARLVIATETDEGSRWNEARIKALTGRDAIAARHMHRSTFEFKPQFKLVFVGNHRPALRSVGEEMRRRIDLIEWGGTIPEGERVLDLPDRLRAEYPAILAWMIEGCLLWQREGLGQPASVTANVREYIQSEDILGAWQEERTETKPWERTRTSAAYANYKRWAESRGEYVLSQKRFTQALKDRGFAVLKSMGFPHFVDLRLKPSEEGEDYVPDSARWTPD